jgi:cytochrome c oxidase subunit II
MSLSPRTRTAPGLIVAGLFVVAILLVFALAAATGTDIRGALQGAVDSLFPPKPATAQATEVRDLYNIVFFLAAAVFILVEVLIVWTVVRYRRRPDDEDLPAQTHGNNLAEILWTVIPTLIVAYMFFVSWQTLNHVDAVSAQPALQVRATAGQFQWTFDYLADDGETSEYTQFVPTGDEGGLFLPVGQPIRVYLESADVVHAFYVPRFLFKRDVVPGQTNKFEFTLNQDEAGQTFRGQCAELCGSGHRIMTFVVHALSHADFDSWLQTAKSKVPPSQAPGGSGAPGGPGGPGGSGGPGASGGTAPPNATTVDVTAEGIAFDKKELEVPAAQPFAIHFVNKDGKGTVHDVDIRDHGGQTIVDDPTTDGGQETVYQVKALQPGTYTFICSIHPIPNMTGTLTVK